MQIQQAAGDGGGIFPTIKLRPQIIAVGQIQPQRRMAGGRQRRHPVVQSGVVLRSQPQIDKETIRPVAIRRQGRLPRYRNNPRTLFAQALGQQLLHPQAEPGNPRRGQQSQLVPPLPRQNCHRRPQDSPGIGGGGVPVAAFPHSGGAAQQLPQIHSD